MISFITCTLFFLSIPLIPYSFGVEVFHFSLYLYMIGRNRWTSYRPISRPLPKYRTTQTQNKRTHTPNIHALSGIRTHDHSVRASENSSYLIPVGYRDRPMYYSPSIIRMTKSRRMRWAGHVARMGGRGMHI
jgi:hypothetical protein